MDNQNWLDELNRHLSGLSQRDRLRQLRTAATLPNHQIQVGDRTFLNLASRPPVCVQS